MVQHKQKTKILQNIIFSRNLSKIIFGRFSVDSEILGNFPKTYQQFPEKEYFHEFAAIVSRVFVKVRIFLRTLTSLDEHNFSVLLPLESQEQDGTIFPDCQQIRWLEGRVGEVTTQ